MTLRPITKVLIANRGEIAWRIIRTCKKMGIKTVAIASEADRCTPVVGLADEVVLIGAAEAKESYLNIEKIVSVAKTYNVDAVHPGYGFLSENADFAAALEAAGIIFIGPGVSAIQAMGSKSQAKAIAEQVHAPTIPGYRGDDQTLARLQQEAAMIGYPLLIKATHGGGGKGMRRVDAAKDFTDALAACQREAMAAFANDAVMLEKLVIEPRHIEVQVFGDQHGNVVALSERDCSIQRRHQKIIEEAPAVGLSEDLRQKLANTAIKIAQAVNYVGAGTVEFLVDRQEHFYFLEMNTRLQVEHPVTEMITGLDLVQWQIQVAEGRYLPLSQENIRSAGHAVELRLYAEDPDNNFLPAIGTLTTFVPPMDLDNVRCDVGYVQGNAVSIYYDPMLAKIIAYGENRAAAMQKVQQALIDFKVVGVKTNRAFLWELLAKPEINHHHPDIGYLDRLLQESTHKSASDIGLILSAWLLLVQQRSTGTSPWEVNDGWRQARLGGRQVALHCFNQPHLVTFKAQPQGYLVALKDKEYLLEVISIEKNQVLAVIDGQSHCAAVLQADAQSVHLGYQGQILECFAEDLDHYHDQSEDTQVHLNAPMPGRVVSVLAQVGQTIEQGMPILILEAMKMEHTIRAPYQGMLESVFYNVGDFVDEGVQLAKVKAA